MVIRAWKRRGEKWSLGDLDFTIRLHPQKGGAGASVYLTAEHIAAALFGAGGRFDRVDPREYVVQRIILQPGTGQVLLRLKKERAPKTGE